MANEPFSGQTQTIEKPAADMLQFSRQGTTSSLEEVLTHDKMSVWTGLVSKGIYNALYGLSQMVGTRIAVTSLDLRWLPAKEATCAIGGPEAEGIGIYLAIEGDATGHLLMMHDIDIAFKLIDIQLGVPLGKTCQIGEMERSVLGEMGNITGSYFLNALADSANLVLMPSPPYVMADMVQAIMNVPLVSIMREQDNALMVKATFSADNQLLNGTFMVLPTLEFMAAILDKHTG